MALDKLNEAGMAWLEVIVALKDFAEILEGKAGPKGTPKRRFNQEERFLHMSCLYFAQQTPGWQHKKGAAERKKMVAAALGLRNK
jgi:hypothetical protein